MEEKGDRGREGRSKKERRKKRQAGLYLMSIYYVLSSKL